MERLSKTWEAAAYNRETNEWDKTTLSSHEHVDEDDLIKPVAIRAPRADRRKPVGRDYKTIFVAGDAQIGYRNIDGKLVPLHDEDAIRAATRLARDIRPDVVVDLGDTTDFAELSRFAPDSNHFTYGTLQPSLQRSHDYFGDLTEATPGAERHTVDSNHVKRLGSYVLKNAMQFANIKQVGEKYPALSYPGLLRLDDIGWEYHGGYGAAEYEYADDLAFMHGTIATSAGSTANKLGKQLHNADRNVVQGHAHRIETQYHTDRRGRQLGAFVVGALCRTDGIVPSYHNGIDANGEPVRYQEDWQQGIMVARDYGNGHYEFDQVPIHKGEIHYQGKTY